MEWLETVPCAGRPAVWGAGALPASDEAREGCGRCEFVDPCLDRYARQVPSPTVDLLTGLVVGGLDGRDLVIELRRRKRRLGVAA